MRFEVGASSVVDCASLGQCLRLRGFVNFWCLLFCLSFCYVTVTFEGHKTYGP